jgi:PAS domain S-box-containing protein
MAKANILVVEDNPVIAGMIRRFLTKSDYEIAGMVTTGEEAVRLAGHLKPRLTLMDVQLAGKMDGIAAAHLIWDRFHIPIVYLTGNSDAETIARAASSEAYGYLLKPVQERDLMSTIQAAIDRHDSECRIREHENWLTTTFECVADAVIGTDALGCVKHFNPAAEALIGWKQAEAMGQNLATIFKVLEKDSRKPAECAVVDVIRTKLTSRTGQLKILVARDGTETTGTETAAPIFNHGGNIAGVVLVFRNTTAGELTAAT